ncbi:MAG: tRNA (adenosine(37)-N6)-threonylcarbamoyltransferase complex dimerization subunit type 1 TsaB [candidate division WOR-3 bacterium]|nr:MAG: tRNA (adenosine(37)-N6)-threonylcarbamoyltransferase complex dimerization subunit type 1 TsaB [candidate division WOR-3 bacterium]
MFSLCINEDDKVVYEIKKERTSETGRGADFFFEAKKIIDHHKPSTLRAIAVSIGPGMFTSLRVGLSLAKGLALAHKTPVVAVNTLDVIGVSLAFVQRPILAVINAYHGELYAALYEQGKRTTDYRLTIPQDIKKIIKDNVLVLGSGTGVLEDSGFVANMAGIHFVNADFLLPTASKVVSVALPRIRSGSFDDPEMLEPYYIKKTDAERNYDKSNAT